MLHLTQKFLTSSWKNFHVNNKPTCHGIGCDAFVPFTILTTSDWGIEIWPSRNKMIITIGNS